jgi:hypothetical protein
MKTKWKYVITVFTMAVLCISVCTTTTNATVVWSDDFNDGNYDGWTICNNTILENGGYGLANSNWSAVDNCLQVNHEDYGIITHPSDVAYGKWSFDFRANESQVYEGQSALIEFIANNEILSTDNWNDPVSYYIRYMVFAGPEEDKNFTLQLRKWYDGVATTIDTYQTPVVTGWHHFDVTRNTTGWFSVYLNGSPVLEGEDTDITTSELFWLWFEKGQMIDNIVVDDDWNFTTTTTLDGTDGDTTFMLIIAGVGVAVVVIVLAIIFLRRR